MKIGLVLPGNIWMSPYLEIYTQILKKANCHYEIISWNRDGTDAQRGFQYDEPQKTEKSRINKFLPYYRYIKFVKRTIKAQKFEKLIIFGPQIGIPLSNFLAKHYKGQYLFDYRDLSIEQYSILKKLFIKVLNNSRRNIISSPGFKECLPSGFDYLISHNFDVSIVRKTLTTTQKDNWPGLNQCLEVLTIGSIRDYSSNSVVIKALSNNPKFFLNFVGKGVASSRLQEYAHILGTQNINFMGYYPKEQECNYINKCAFLNIYYPNILSHSTALSNRFYNALIYKRPMIVSPDSIQGDYAQNNNLGVVVKDSDGLPEALIKWYSSNNFSSFSNRCNELLENFLADYDAFHSAVVKFIANE